MSNMQRNSNFIPFPNRTNFDPLANSVNVDPSTGLANFSPFTGKPFKSVQQPSIVSNGRNRAIDQYMKEKDYYDSNDNFITPESEDKFLRRKQRQLDYVKGRSYNEEKFKEKRFSDPKTRKSVVRYLPRYKIENLTIEEIERTPIYFNGIHDILRYTNEVEESTYNIYWDVNDVNVRKRLRRNLFSKKRDDKKYYWPDYKCFGTSKDILKRFLDGGVEEVEVGLLHRITAGLIGCPSGIVKISEEVIINCSINPTNPQHHYLIDSLNTDDYENNLDEIREEQKGIYKDAVDAVNYIPGGIGYEQARESFNRYV